MDKIKYLLMENKAWAKGKTQIDPHYFEKMAIEQTPEYLWIGCSDSRVPPGEITNTDPGQMFVHRNVANLVHHTDMNLLSVLQFAVEQLKVPHIIVCGHYNCGGVKAALLNKKLGLIDHWIQNIKQVQDHHRLELAPIVSEEEKVNRLVELNVLAQVKNLENTSIIQQAWARQEGPSLHGWVYDLKTGLLKTLTLISLSQQKL